MRGCALLLIFAASLIAESAGGLKWTPPAGWKSSGTTSMRAATYPVPAAPGDKDAAECAVYYFGPGQGGTVEANLERWEGQFQGPGGKPAFAKTAQLLVHGLPVTTIDVSGRYSGMGGPTAATPTYVSGYRLLGAIIQGKPGNIFIKFTGPSKTIAANQGKFNQLVNSFEKTGP